MVASSSQGCRVSHTNGAVPERCCPAALHLEASTRSLLAATRSPRSNPPRCSLRRAARPDTAPEHGNPQIFVGTMTTTVCHDKRLKHGGERDPMQALRRGCSRGAGGDLACPFKKATHAARGTLASCLHARAGPRLTSLLTITDPVGSAPPPSRSLCPVARLGSAVHDESDTESD